VVAAAAPVDDRISWCARGDISSDMHRGSELGAAASTTAIWWNLHFASLLVCDEIGRLSSAQTDIIVCGFMLVT